MATTSLALRKLALAIAAAVTATAGLSALNPAAASAASGMTIRIAPVSNAFLFVEVEGSSGQPGAGIIQWPYNGGQNQVWTFRPAGTDYEIVNQWSGQCITTDGVAGHWLWQAPCQGLSGQKWATALTPGNLIGYPIRNPASNLYMDVQGASTTQGAHIGVWYGNGGHNQYFVGSVA